MDDRLREAPADLSAIEQAAMAQWGDTAQNHNRARRILAAPSTSPPAQDLDQGWFDEIEDFLDDYQDAEIIDGTTHPNKAMRLLCQLRGARS